MRNSTASLSEGQLNSWVASQNKILTSRSDYEYDGRDQLVKSKNFSAVNSSGVGIINSAMEESRFAYDEHGKLRQSITVKGNATYITSYAYDGMGRLLATTNPKTQAVFSSYAGNKITTTSAEGKVSIQTFDAAGKLSSSTVTGAGSTATSKYVYDSAGRLSMTENALGQRSYTFYDAAGRVSGSVDGTGAVTENIYSKTGQLTKTLAYANLVNTSGWFNGSVVVKASLAQIRPALHGNDRTTQFNYDDSGRLTSSVDALGIAAMTNYDDASRVTAQTQAGVITCFFYDKDGLKTGVLDGENNLTKFTYNAQGQLVETIRYYNKGDTSGTATANTKDQHSYNYYDGAGHLVATVDPEGYLTEFVFDNNNNKKREINYKTPATGINSGTTLTTLRTKGAVVVSYSEHYYNNLGQLEKTINGEGVSTTYSYNKDGHLTQEVSGLVGSDTSHSHTINYAVNQLGQVTQVSGDTSTANYTYDLLGRKYSDSLNHITSQSYDAVGRATTSANTLYQTMSNNYDAFGNVTSVVDGARVVNFLADKNGQTRYTLDALGYITEFKYDAAGHKTDAITYARQFPVDSFTSISSVSSWLGAVRAEDRHTQYVYNKIGQLTSTTDAEGKIEIYAYDALGNKTSFTDKRGNVWQYSYDKNRRLLEEISPQVGAYVDSLGSPSSNGSYKTGSVVTKFAYNHQGAVTARTELFRDTANAEHDVLTTYFSYDIMGRQVKTTLPGYYHASTGLVNGSSAGGTQTTSQTIYNARGQAVVGIDEAGNSSHKVYNKQGQLRFELDSERYVTEYQYDAKGNQIKTTRYNNRFNISGYENTELSEAVVISRLSKNSSLDRSITKTYDELGRVSSVKQDAISIFDPIHWRWDSLSPETQYEYNRFGEVIKEHVKINSLDWADTYHFYNSNGQKTATVDAGLYLTTFAYNSFGLLETQTEYAGTVSSISTSSYGSPAAGSATIGYNRITTFSYDELGRKISENHSGRVTRFEYDAKGNITATVNAAGGREESEFDGLDRVTRASGVSHQVFNGGDLFNGAAKYDRQVTDFSYDSHGNLKKQSNVSLSGREGNVVTDNYYDYRSRKIGIRNANGSLVEMAYNQKGQVTKESRQIYSGYNYWSSLSLTSTKTYTYDKVGQLVLSTHNGQSGYSDDKYERAAYNAFGEVTEKGSYNSSANTGWQFTYSYDKAGNLTRAKGADSVYTSNYYDLHGSLTYSNKGGRQTFNYMDKLGHITRQQQPRINGAVPNIYQTSDRWGNVITSKDARGYSTYMRFDKFDKMTRQQLPSTTVMRSNGSTYSLAPITTYQYDSLGNLTNISDAGGHTQQWSYDSAGLMQWSKDQINRYTYYRYDAFGQQIGKKDALGRVTKTTFDNLGQVTRQGYINSAGSYSWGSKSYQYNALGQRIADITLSGTSTAEAAGYALYSQYDARGNVIRTRDLAGRETSSHYDHQDRKIYSYRAHTGAVAQIWSYDAYHLKTHSDMAGVVTSYSYNGLGQLSNESKGGINNSYSYWENGWLRKITTTGIDSGFTQLATDMASWQFAKLGSTHRISSAFSVSNLSRTESTEYYYDLNGNRSQEISSSERSFSMSAAKEVYVTSQYGSSSWQSDGVFQSGLSYHYARTVNNSYDAQGRLTQVTSPQSIFTPKALLVAASVAYGSSVPEQSVNETSGLKSLAYHYDELGNRRHIKSEVYKLGSSGIVETKDLYYTYDSANRMLISQGRLYNGTIDIAQEGAHQILYDNAYWRIQDSWKDGDKYRHETYSYQYDSARVLVTKAVENSSETSFSGLADLSSRAYDSLGNLTSETRYNDYNDKNKGARGSYLSSMTNSYVGSELRSQTNYARKDNFTTTSSTYGGTSVTYSGYSQVKQAALNYTYDSAGLQKGNTLTAYKDTGATLYTDTYSMVYQLGNSAQLLENNVSTARDGWRSSSIKQYYDARGNCFMCAAVIKVQKVTTVILLITGKGKYYPAETGLKSKIIITPMAICWERRATYQIPILMRIITVLPICNHLRVPTRYKVETV
ncbi:hypothetical protein [Psychromonas sp. MME2]|uniref:hypothetical protein n=1 Tax=Psychromonas sp. MME2 TaxID=3231033 RepID=UPI00339C058B